MAFLLNASRQSRFSEKLDYFFPDPELALSGRLSIISYEASLLYPEPDVALRADTNSHPSWPNLFTSISKLKSLGETILYSHF